MPCHVRIKKSDSLLPTTPRHNILRPKLWGRTDLETFVVFLQKTEKSQRKGDENLDFETRSAEG